MDEISGTNKLILLTLFVLIIYLMFFNFNVQKAYDYTVSQVMELVGMFK